MDIDIEGYIVNAIKENLDDCIVDLISDMSHDNPDWWAGHLNKVLEPALKKALQDASNNLLRELCDQALEEFCSGGRLEDIVNEEAREFVQSKLAGLRIDVVRDSAQSPESLKD